MVYIGNLYPSRHIRQNDVFWRNYDIFIAPCASWGSLEFCHQWRQELIYLTSSNACLMLTSDINSQGVAYTRNTNIFWLGSMGSIQLPVWKYSRITVDVSISNYIGDDISYVGDNWYILRSWSWWRHQMETFSALLAICAGNSPVPGEFPTQRPVTRSFDVFFHLRLNKRLSKHS